MENLEALKSWEVEDKQKDLGNNWKVALYIMFPRLFKLGVVIAVISKRK